MLSLTFPQRWISSKRPSHGSTYTSHVCYCPAVCPNRLESRCADLRQQIQTLQEGEYAIAKADVDLLRAELGQPPLPPLQTKLDEKTSQ